jgi:hypothetical protein
MTSQARAAEKRPLWKDLWPAIASVAASILFHTVHLIGVLAAAGASSFAHHMHHHGSRGGPGMEWLFWVGWGLNGITLLFAIHCLVAYLRHRRTDPKRAASHLTVSLLSFVIVFAAIGMSL